MTLRFDPLRLPAHCQALREEVRAFLAQERAAGTYDPEDAEPGLHVEKAFARKVAASLG